MLAAGETARILLAGQAPGRRVHETGIPWNDPSGEKLREWLDLDKDTFYDENLIAIVPMGFCYPGTGKNGDLPPRPECAQLWHDSLIATLPNIALTLAIGAYAQRYHLADRRKRNLTETVKAWREYGDFIPLPHPSPRNIAWLVRNPWFEAELIPVLRERVHEVLGNE